MTGSAHRSRGLTLLELLVVITLMALVTATVTVKIQGRLGAAGIEQAVSQWEFADEQLRNRARQAGRTVALQGVVGSNEIECALDPEDDSQRTMRSLGKNIDIARYRSATREITRGPFAIEYFADGTSETYLVEIAAGQMRRRLLAAGITGQITDVTDADTETLFDEMLPSGVHAD